MAVKTYIEALSDGLREEMHRDPKVFMLGEDIGQYGGAFKVTKGFLEEFGPERIVDTPLAESAIIGVSIGAALMGMRPVAEMQFSDFVACGFNQLINNAAKMHYRWGAPVPMVVRLPSGGGVHGGPFHSQNPEAWFCHTPGLKVVAPSTPRDAKGLIKAAIRDDNPVLYFEHKYLYRRIKEEMPENGDGIVEIGRGDIKRPGKDVSIITYGSMVHFSLEAAAKLAEEGIEVEVMDLRSLLPYDQDMISETVRKTNRCVVVHEATRTCGFGAEVMAFVAEELFTHLDAPVKRVTSIDTPVPYAPPLEEYFMPNADKIAAAVRQVVEF